MEFKELMALARGHAQDAGGRRCEHEETDQAALVWDFEAANPLTGDKIGPVAKVLLVVRTLSGGLGRIEPQLDVLAVDTLSRGEGVGVLAVLSRVVFLMDQLEGLAHRPKWPLDEISAWLRTRVRGKICAWDGLDLDPDV